MWELNEKRPGRPNTLAPSNVVRWLERATAFEGIAPFYDYRVSLTGSGAPEEIVTLDVTPSFFPTLGVPPLLGRTFASDEGPEGHDAVAVLSHGLWQRRFAGDAAVVGSTLQINGRPVTVIGVMPPDARFFLKRWSLTGKPAEMWMPFAFSAASRTPRGRYMSAIARLKPGVALSAAQANGHGHVGAADRVSAVRRRMGRAAGAAPTRDVGRTPAGAAGAHRGRRLRPADRVRECRQPAARARRDPPA
jgi:putative ABC transport system permease protein